MIRLTKLRARAIVLLFLEGHSAKEIARAFRLKRTDVDEVLRRCVR
jgi:DNA-directed RNA polymerase specialized sigma24 family protein